MSPEDNKIRIWMFKGSSRHRETVSPEEELLTAIKVFYGAVLGWRVTRSCAEQNRSVMVCSISPYGSGEHSRPGKTETHRKPRPPETLLSLKNVLKPIKMDAIKLFLCLEPNSKSLNRQNPVCVVPQNTPVWVITPTGQSPEVPASCQTATELNVM